MQATNWKRSTAAIVTGTLLGLGAGVILAPQSGAQTRRQMRVLYEEARENLRNHAQDLGLRLNETAKQTRSGFRHWLEEKLLAERHPVNPQRTTVEGLPLVVSGSR